MTTIAVPRAFIWRRLHSLMGLWLVLFLSEHLLTNSQAALWLGAEGSGFVRMVNALHNLPYLQAIELTLIGIPLAIHMVWGVRYALEGRKTKTSSDGSKPIVPSYRNRAYSWQRMTSWFLLVFLILHVVKFRFIEYPETVQINQQSHYVVTISPDEKLQRLAQTLDVSLHDQGGKVAAVCKEFGTATLLTVRDTFKNPVYIALYTLFVLVACFHAYNGFWTFLLTWGWVLKMSAQRAWTAVSLSLIALFVFLGLSAVWGSYLLGGGS